VKTHLPPSSYLAPFFRPPPRLFGSPPGTALFKHLARPDPPLFPPTHPTQRPSCLFFFFRPKHFALYNSKTFASTPHSELAELYFPHVSVSSLDKSSPLAIALFFPLAHPLLIYTFFCFFISFFSPPALQIPLPPPPQTSYACVITSPSHFFFSTRF